MSSTHSPAQPTMSIPKPAPTPAHLHESMMRSVAVLPEGKRLILFTRHSLRERSNGGGFASSDLPLTPKGRVLAKAWGRWLAEHLPYSLDTPSIASPIMRCVNTAILMQEGARVSHPVTPQTLLVEPGSLVTDAERANALFKQIGALNFINAFLANSLDCTKSAEHGAGDLLHLLFEHQPKPNQLALAVSHDTLLAAFLGVMLRDFMSDARGKRQLDWNDWPKMMEGVFVWFDDADKFADATAYLIWRGVEYELPVSMLYSS